MAKHSEKLSKDEVRKIFYQLCLALSKLENPEQASKLLQDLLSLQEAEMIAKRLKIAELLLENMSYEDIRKALKVSPGTIARVQEWLKISGEGYREAVKNTRGKDIDLEKEYAVVDDWNSIKKRYPMYYWPEILLENIVKAANKKEKTRIRKVLKQMEKMKRKNALYKKLNKLINYKYR